MKIGFTGSHSTGKSTLVAKLVSDYPHFAKHTNASRILSQSLPLFKNNNDADITSQSVIVGSICLDLLQNQDLIADRTIIDTIAYTIVNDNLGKSVAEDLWRVFGPAATQYDIIFYTPIEFPLTPDGTRCEDETYRRDVDKAIFQLLNDKQIPYVVLSGSVDERVDTMWRVINEYMS